MFQVHTGLWWFDITVWVVSGGAFCGLCYYFPKYIVEQYRFWYQYFLDQQRSRESETR